MGAPGTVGFDAEGHVGVRDRRCCVVGLEGHAVVGDLLVGADGGGVEGSVARGGCVRWRCWVGDVDVVVGAGGRVVVDGEDISGTEGVVVDAP